MIKKRKTTGKRVAPIFQSAGIGAVCFVLLFAMLLIGITPEQHDIHVGSPATIDILATKDVNDTVTTQELRDKAAAAVEYIYKSVDVSVVGQVVSNMEGCFSALLALRQDTIPEQALAITDAQLEQLNNRLDVDLTQEQYVALIETDEDTLRQIFNDAVASVRDTMNSTLPEGQEANAVNRVSRTLAMSGYPAPLVVLATDVARQFIQPNMLIDEETTEARRREARDAVEMKTCVKGEVIVRRGDIVTEAQYTMLSSLGLLKEDKIDIPLIAGIALFLLMVMTGLVLYMRRYQMELLRPRTAMLIALIMVIVTALSLGISRWNPYMMPVSLGMLLISILVDRRLAFHVNLALGFIASLLTDASNGVFTVAMFSVLLMNLLAGPIVMTLFSRRMQRITSLLAGVLVGISNLLCTLAVGLINSADLTTVMTNALWAMGGGILSAVMCIGFQPLLELLFNLATNPRLIELSNPNQPLLRRLLMEAPGTYHHSIIVANLAEAAATEVGGNGLLARVGAYYHDIGKLKRPAYFMENQMGDNPHDRTDPRVSAAILTAHPRDGAAMAAKARIPEPVIEIIRQHHGDGIALFFYDKAIKQYGADHVDISAFRYDGPRPHSKEAAAVMLADTIEAAARSLPDPTPEKIDATIRKLVRSKLDDGQLDESDLTFRDMEKICSAFSTVLTGVFHERIEYPDIPIPERSAETNGSEAAPEQREGAENGR